MDSDPRGWLRRELEPAAAPEPTPESERSGRADHPTTFIHDGCQLEGRLLVKSSIHVTGEFRGTIESEETVTVDAEAAVEADIFARMVIVHGAVVGRIEASREVVLHAGSRLHGDVRAPSLVIERGAFFSGQTQMYRPELEIRRRPQDHGAAAGAADQASPSTLPRV